MNPTQVRLFLVFVSVCVFAVFAGEKVQTNFPLPQSFLAKTMPNLRSQMGQKRADSLPLDLLQNILNIKI